MKNNSTLRRARDQGRRSALWAALFVTGSMGCAASPMAGSDASDAASEAGPSCTPGAQCGNDCQPSDAPCWACGELQYNAQCQCVPAQNLCAPATGCDSAAPASAGEFCGTQRWCNRPCAAGLECTGVPAGANAERDFRRVCVAVGDGGADGAVRD